MQSELTDKESEAVEAYKHKGSQAKAAKYIGISRRAFRSRLDSANKKILDTPVGFKTTKIATNAEGIVTAMQHKLAPEITDEERTGKIIRRSTLYGADGSVTGEWIIRQPEEEKQADFKDALDKHFVENVKPITSPLVLKSDNSEDNLALFLSVDEHIGVSLAFDAVGQDYGLADAVNLMADRFERIVNMTPKSTSCLYVNLGDQFHTNDHMGVTPASKHALETDGTFNGISDAVVALNRYRIDLLLKKFDNVNLRGVAGNHDYDPMGWLFRCYEIAFEGDDRVSSKFWSDELGVEKFGNNMLGFHHGHRMKPDVMAGACADRYPSVYGSTQMRYLHTGHFHHDRALDTWGGFKFEGHRTMNPKDDFSYKNGYLSRQSMKSMVYDKHEGEIARFTTTLI